MVRQNLRCTLQHSLGDFEVAGAYGFFLLVGPDVASFWMRRQRRQGDGSHLTAF
jgi:hypothetical protein